MQNHLTLKSINFDTTSPTDLKNLSGLLICLLRIKYCLSVGAFFERPRANAVRPYRVLDNFFANFARPYGGTFYFINLSMA